MSAPTLGSALAVIALAVAPIAPANAHPATPSAKRATVAKVKHHAAADLTSRYDVTLSNGRRVRGLKQCAYEDSPNCVWDSVLSGDGRGRSFVDLGGRLYVIPARLMRAAYADADRRA